MRRPILIVNADDFGLTEGTDNAILRAHRQGIVTSTSLLANGYAFEHALALARATPSLDVGLHLTLTEGPPVAPLREVPDLVDEHGELPLSNQPFARKLATGKLPIDQIRREFEAQAAKVADSNLRPSHIDGHKYIHLLPGISAIAADVALRFGIPVMRVPHRLADPPSRPGRIPGMIVMVGLGIPAYRTARAANLRTTDRMVGFADTGHLTRPAVQALLRRPRPGITELLCHPADRSPMLETLRLRGYEWIGGYDFEGETQAVSDPDLREYVEKAGWQRLSFAEAFKE